MEKIKLVLPLMAILALAAAAGCGSGSVDLTDGLQENLDASMESLVEPTVFIDPSAGDLIPDGVLVISEDLSTLIYLDKDGQPITQIQAPGIGPADPSSVVIAGLIVDGQPFPPILYRSWEPGQGLMANQDGQVSSLRQSNYLLSMVGAPGQPLIVFSEVQFNSENHPHTFLYSGTVETIGTIGAFYDLVDAPNYWPLSPVGINTISGQSQAVWYTKSAWGIGGADLIFPITKGLYLFDLTTGDTQQYINDSQSFQGISPGLTYAGSIDVDPSGSRAMSIISLTDLHGITFPLDPASDRGAGFVVFSPDDRFAAWLEASGSMISDPYDFHARVRVGEVQTGGVVGVVDDRQAAQTANRSLINFMRPVGWLDNSTLLMEVRGENWGDVNLLKFDVVSNTLAFFSPGSLVGFGYK